MAFEKDEAWSGEGVKKEMKTNTQQFFDTASDFILQFKNTTIDRDLLIEQAKKTFRNELVKAGNYTFTRKDEKRLLHTFENENFDHFYIESKPIKDCRKGAASYLHPVRRSSRFEYDHHRQPPNE